MIREVRECRVDVVKEVDNAAEVLVIPDVLDVMFLTWIEVQSDGRKASQLAADIIEADLLTNQIGRIARRYVDRSDVKTTN